MVEPISEFKTADRPMGLTDLGDLPASGGTYLVGGTVRDLLLNRRPADYDLVVTGSPQAYGHRLLRSTPGRLVVIGKPGKSVVRVVTAERVFDICPVNGGQIEKDLSARDFTVNAMAFSLSTNRLVDPFGGRDDLAAHIIRMVSPATFRNDPVRLLRAYRMAAQLGFRIEKDTSLRAAKDAALIRLPAGERLREELFKLLSSRGSAVYLEDMACSGVLCRLLPELDALRGLRQPPPHRYDVFDHTLETVHQLETILENPPYELREFQPQIGPLAGKAEGARLKCAALLHDIGKPMSRSIDVNGRAHFYGHADHGAEQVARISHRLRFSKLETDYISMIIRHHTRPLSLFDQWKRERLSARAVARLFKALGDRSPDLVLHSMADMRAKGADDRTGRAFDRFCVDLIGQFYSRFKPTRSQPPLITGHDLIKRFGLKPSPLFARLLDEADTAQLAGTITNKEEAERFVQKLLDESRTDA